MGRKEGKKLRLKWKLWGPCPTSGRREVTWSLEARAAIDVAVVKLGLQGGLLGILPQTYGRQGSRRWACSRRKDEDHTRLNEHTCSFAL